MESGINARKLSLRTERGAVFMIISNSRACLEVERGHVFLVALLNVPGPLHCVLRWLGMLGYCLISVRVGLAPGFAFFIFEPDSRAADYIAPAFRLVTERLLALALVLQDPRPKLQRQL
jgi:hypothetical protein